MKHPDVFFYFSSSLPKREGATDPTKISFRIPAMLVGDTAILFFNDKNRRDTMLFDMYRKLRCSSTFGRFNLAVMRITVGTVSHAKFNASVRNIYEVCMSDASVSLDISIFIPVCLSEVMLIFHERSVLGSHRR